MPLGNLVFLFSFFLIGFASRAVADGLPPAQLAGRVELRRILPEASFLLATLCAQAPGEDSRFYVMEQAGTIKAVDQDPLTGKAITTTWLDLSTTVSLVREEGLLGLAFDPNYPVSREFYVLYSSDTPTSAATTIISRFQAPFDASEPVDPSTEEILISIEKSIRLHVGGTLAFGPDGMLYISLGDDEDPDDPSVRKTNGQDTTTLPGSILRIDVRGVPDAGLPYRIPPDNPFYNGGPSAETRKEIYAYGFRNPFRFSFDEESGLLYAGDVGQGTLEEVNLVFPGGNYGWAIREGTICNTDGPQTCPSFGLIPPIAQYPHVDGNAAIIGGYVYRGSRYPEFAGTYFFSDANSRRIGVLRFDENGSTPITWVARAPEDVFPIGWVRMNNGEIVIAGWGGIATGLFVLEFTDQVGWVVR